MNRAIRARDLDAIYITGPGPRRARRWSPTPSSRAPTARSTRRSRATRRACARLFRQFSFPGGIPSHVAPETPGSIHEGGELGYALAHAYGAAFDNPDLLVALRRRRRRGGDRPARGELALEQVPQPGARRRGAADPAPQRLQDRQPDGARAHPARRADVRSSRATATSRIFVEGDDPAAMHQLHGRRRSTRSLDEIARSRRRARADGHRARRAGR